MATTKLRINISADQDMEFLLKQSAKRDHIPLATKAARLLRMALEIEEDMTLAAIADRRTAKKVKYIPHELAWG